MNPFESFVCGESNWLRLAALSRSRTEHPLGYVPLLAKKDLRISPHKRLTMILTLRLLIPK